MEEARAERDQAVTSLSVGSTTRTLPVAPYVVLCSLTTGRLVLA